MNINNYFHIIYGIPFVQAVGDDNKRALDDLCKLIWRRLDDSWKLDVPREVDRPSGRTLTNTDGKLPVATPLNLLWRFGSSIFF